MQYIIEILYFGGCVVVVVLDNVLFEGGKGMDICCDLMDKCYLYIILCLLIGIFYVQGVKMNVLFFIKGMVVNLYQDKNCIDDVWVYDLCINMLSFGKCMLFIDEYLQLFECVYGEDLYGLSLCSEGEWSFNVEEMEVVDSEENKNIDQYLVISCWCKFICEWICIMKFDLLDIFWLKDKDSIDVDNLLELDVLVVEVMGELVQVLGELDVLICELGVSDEVDVQCQLLEEVFGGVKE